MVKKTALFIMLIGCGFIPLLHLQAQTRNAVMDLPAKVVEPSNYDPVKAYPLLIVAAPTGWDAEGFWLSNMKNILEPCETFIMLMPGEYNRADYLPDFISFVGWYDDMVQRELAHAREKYKIDEKRISMIGYSLGGDLTWALNARNPELFCGMIVAGSRCSYPLKKEDLSALAGRDFRAGFVMGGDDSATRLTGNKNAQTTLKNGGIPVRYNEVPGYGHSGIPGEEKTRDLLWAMHLESQ